jgi:hypothetical protein
VQLIYRIAEMLYFCGVLYRKVDTLNKANVRIVAIAKHLNYCNLTGTPVSCHNNKAHKRFCLDGLLQSRQQGAVSVEEH